MHEHTWLDSLDGHEEGDTLGMRLFKIIIPFAIPAAVFAILFFTMDYGKWLQLGGLALGYLFPPFGKESIIPIGIGFGFTVLQMTGLIFMVGSPKQENRTQKNPNRRRASSSVFI